MRHYILILISIISIGCSAQEKLPILKSTSEIISIKEGNVIYPNVWSISPKIKWDEYVMKHIIKETEISFYSDIDTITFKVEPNNQYDFIIIHDEKKAYTRISSDTTKEASIPIMEILEYSKLNKNRTVSLADTIPFRLGDDNRIHILGKINDSDSLDFLFDTGANAIAITSSLIGERVKIKMTGETENIGSDGVSIKETSANNKLEIGNLRWDNVSITSIDYKNSSFDGVLGWIAFGGKVVEIDYENSILVIHQSMPAIPDGYSKIESAMIGGIPYIKSILTVDGNDVEGWFEYDTGGVRSFYLSQEFAAQNDLNNTKMKLIGTTYASGSKGVKWKRNIFRLPKIAFGEFQTYLIPIAIAEQDPEGVSFNDILGNNLLKRFNALIDFENYTIYLKPNILLHSEY